MPLETQETRINKEEVFEVYKLNFRDCSTTRKQHTLDKWKIRKTNFRVLNTMSVLLLPAIHIKGGGEREKGKKMKNTTIHTVLLLAYIATETCAGCRAHMGDNACTVMHTFKYMVPIGFPWEKYPTETNIHLSHEQPFQT